MMRAGALLILMFACNLAAAGGMVGNGGDAVLQEFNLRGLQLSAYFHANPASAANIGLDPDRFLQIVRATKLEGVNHLYLNGQEVDAINYPAEMRIQVSHTRWEESAKRGDAYFVQRRIALHEWLWVYGLDDSGYAYSNPLIVEMEKSVGPITDPDVQAVLLRKFCGALSLNDFDQAKSFLIWGLDLNANCPGQNSAPFDWLLINRPSVASPTPDRREWLSMIESMLEFGLNPNTKDFTGYPVIATAWFLDADFATMLFRFGADPNIDPGNGQTAFNLASNFRSPGALTLDGVKLFMDNGADPNLTRSGLDSPARNFVSRENNADIVEYLIQTGKVDWCGIADWYWNQPRTLDAVRPEYAPLLKHYGVTCPRLKVAIGNKPTCEESKADAIAQCAAEGYRIMTLKPWSEEQECMKSGSGPGQEAYISRYFCAD